MSANVLRLGGRFNAAKPLLYEVPTYLALNFNRSNKQKTKRKKAMAKLEIQIGDELHRVVYIDYKDGIPHQVMTTHFIPTADKPYWRLYWWDFFANNGDKKTYEHIILEAVERQKKYKLHNGLMDILGNTG